MHRWLGGFCSLALLTAAAAGDDWPQFRGPHRDNISRETGLLRAWPDGGPKVLWSVEVCQGYAAAAIHSGRVYFNDYNEEAREWYVRCLTLDEGKELWRYADSKRIRPNHGITRTVPTVDGTYVFSLDPKCVLHCLDAQTGRPQWTHDTKQEIWSSPFVADGKVYVGTQRKWLWVFRAGRQKKLLAKVRLPRAISCTPIAANGVLYIATTRRLYAVCHDPK